MEWAERAVSFDRAVELYERSRPTYPLAAVRWLVPAAAGSGPPPRVIDLAAGTGKLTRVLLAAGCDVTAVEPLPGMRAEFARQLPGVPVHDGTAEAIPLPDAGADALVVGQAWHWFEPEAAAAEIARVLRPGGTVGLVWNEQDDSVRWVAEMRTILHEIDSPDLVERRDDGLPSWRPPLGEAFDPAQMALFDHVQHVDLATLLDNLASRSYVISLPEGERAAMLAAVAQLLRTHPQTAGLDRYDLPYRTRCWRAVRR